jgi:hypothetical protein
MGDAGPAKVLGPSSAVVLFVGRAVFPRSVKGAKLVAVTNTPDFIGFAGYEVTLGGLEHPSW